MSQRTCSIENCANSVRARGWCGKHYERWRTYGDPQYEYIPEYTLTCSVEGCYSLRIAKSYCPRHYERFNKYGDPEYLRPLERDKLCSFSGCSNKRRRNGLCSGHSQMQKRGEILRPLRRRRKSSEDPAHYFWEQVDTNGQCWLWLRTVDTKGYGTFYPSGDMVRAHRYAYELVNGSIPEGMHIDHICRNKRCVRPEHLRIATHNQNMQNLPNRSRKNTSGYRGVSQDKRDGRWTARATKDGKTYSAGRFDTPEEAGVAAAILRSEVFTYSTN